MNEQPPSQVEVIPRPRYLPEQSSPDLGRYVFAYTIRIINHGPCPVRLVSRHWVITDADGRVQEVRGLGVVGEQPRLEPGEVFEYTSGTIMETPVGTMEGSYQMITDEGEAFEVPIPAFTLSVPLALH